MTTTERSVVDVTTVTTMVHERGRLMLHEHSPAPVLLTPEEAAAILGRDVAELRRWRGQSIGPTFHDLGRGLIVAGPRRHDEHPASPIHTTPLEPQPHPRQWAQPHPSYFLLYDRSGNVPS